MASYTYPVARPDGALSASQIHLLLSRPPVIQKRLQTLLDQKFLADYALTAEGPVLNGMFDLLNPSGASEILFDNFRQLFQKEVEAEVAALLTHIGFVLQENKLTLLELLKQFTKSARTIALDEALEAFRSKGMQVKKPDFEFALSHFNADKLADIDYVEINKLFGAFCRAHAIKFIDQFNDKGSPLD